MSDAGLLEQADRNRIGEEQAVRGEAQVRRRPLEQPFADEIDELREHAIGGDTEAAAERLEIDARDAAQAGHHRLAARRLLSERLALIDRATASAHGRGPFPWIAHVG